MTIFFVILSVVILIVLLILYSSIKIEIKSLEIINKKILKIELIISLALFGKIKWIRLKIDNKRIEKIKNSTKTNIMNKILKSKMLKKYKNLREIAVKDWKQILKELNKFEIEKLKLEAKIGTENATTTAISTGIISAILGIILARRTANTEYKIEPIYINKNYIYLSINCIISIKMVHIISILKELKRKGVYQKYGGTSNRRTYANSNG